MNVGTVVDISEGSVECAAAAAAWKSFGNDEGRIEFFVEEGRWQVAFDAAPRR